MSIQYALLTSLLEKPAAGYALAHRFDRSIGYFWQATHQQIYRELGRMEKAGWLSVTVEGEPGTRRRKVYQVLPAGRQALIEWVMAAFDEQESLESCRRTLLVKLRAEAVLGPLGVAALLTQLIARHEAQLAHYRQIEARDFSAARMPQGRRIQHAILRCGISGEESWLVWARDTLALLKRQGRGSAASLR